MEVTEVLSVGLGKAGAGSTQLFYRNRGEPSTTLHCGKFAIGEETGAKPLNHDKTLPPTHIPSLLSRWELM